MAKISDTHLYYEGSIAIDKELMNAANLLAGEKVQILNFNNSSRFETYVIEGVKGEISLRGPAAKLGKKGDKVIIISYALMDENEARNHKPKIVLLDERNEVKNDKS